MWKSSLLSTIVHQTRHRGLLKGDARRIPLRVVRNERQLGWVGATNVGFRLARGEWLCTLHQDDVWVTGHLSALRDAVRSFPEAGLIVGASIFIDDAGRPLGRWRLPWRGTSPDREKIARRLYVQNFLAIPATCFRADTLRKVLGHLTSSSGTQPTGISGSGWRVSRRWSLRVDRLRGFASMAFRRPSPAVSTSHRSRGNCAWYRNATGGQPGATAASSRPAKLLHAPMWLWRR
jgi:glycosyltransferase involved in cell wall biosynthesis